MNKEDLVFAKILGELYRIQKRLPEQTCYVSDDVIFGLLNGVERIVKNELENLGFVTEKDEDVIINILNDYHNNPEKLEGFNGYYDIENELDKNGIDRFIAGKILTLLKLEGRFTNVIAKMNSSGSPVECKTFEPNEWEV